MTDFNTGMIPPGITTLEQLKVWVDTAFYTIAGAKSYLEIYGLPEEKMFNYNIVNTDDKKIRNVVRSGVSLNPAFLVDGTQKIWMFAEEITTVALPAEFQAD